MATYRKAINPAFEIIGKRRKMAGYLGELFDGEECIHSKIYGNHHEAEVALDQVVFDLMSRNPQAEAEPASTCCFCQKPHNPQTCPEMRALLFAPDNVNAPLDVDFAPSSWAE